MIVDASDRFAQEAAKTLLSLEWASDVESEMKKRAAHWPPEFKRRVFLWIKYLKDQPPGEPEGRS